MKTQTLKTLGKEYYIPHKAVIRRANAEKNKIRILYDASANKIRIL